MIFRIEFDERTTLSEVARLSHALAHSADGSLVAHDNDWCKIEVPGQAEADYLTELCESTIRVSSFAVVPD